MDIFYPPTTAAWRKWLEDNHASKKAVWVVFYKKKSSYPSITWSEAVDEALCFGWIDSKKISIDAEQSHQFFSPRKPQSTWSKINKNKVAQLIADGRMTEAGYKSIAIAKENGSWTILDDVEELRVPQDLEQALQSMPPAEEYFLGLGKSVKKRMLQWLVLAKTSETRQKRIDQIVAHASRKERPPTF